MTRRKRRVTRRRGRLWWCWNLVSGTPPHLSPSSTLYTTGALSSVFRWSMRSRSGRWSRPSRAQIGIFSSAGQICSANVSERVNSIVVVSRVWIRSKSLVGFKCCVRRCLSVSLGVSRCLLFVTSYRNTYIYKVFIYSIYAWRECVGYINT